MRTEIAPLSFLLRLLFLIPKAILSLIITKCPFFAGIFRNREKLTKLRYAAIRLILYLNLIWVIAGNTTQQFKLIQPILGIIQHKIHTNSNHKNLDTQLIQYHTQKFQLPKQYLLFNNHILYTIMKQRSANTSLHLALECAPQGLGSSKTRHKANAYAQGTTYTL